MKKKNNFSKAVEELMHGQIFSEAEAKRESESTDSEGDSFAYDPPVPVRTEIQTLPESPSEFFINPSRTAFPREEARITKDMTIHGSIATDSDVRIAGSVFGDVDAKGDIHISGCVEGRISGQTVTLDSATTKGDIHSADSVKIGRESKQTGDVEAASVEVDGIVIGNIHSHGSVILRPKASVEGNIHAHSLTMSEGAELKGIVEVRKSL